MAKRKSIPQSTRFDVFKRDSFTCQYCGRKAPDVVLEVDHINPVVKGGGNDILNLVTSCRDCNSGKGARPLTEHQALNKQRAQLEELNERRGQMEMMVEWKAGLLRLDEDKVDVIQSIFQKATGRNFTESGREKIRKAIKEFGFEAIIDATHTSISQYYHDNDSDCAKTFDYIGRIAFCLKREETDPLYGRKRKIRALLERAHHVYNENRLWKALNALCVDDESTDAVEKIVRESRHWSGFWKDLNEYFRGDW